MTELLTIDEAAARLRVSRRTVQSLTKEGRLRSIHPTPGRTLYTEKEIEAFISYLASRRRVA